MLDESYGLLDVALLHELCKTHLGQRFCDTYHRFKLTWSSRDRLLGISEAPHLDVLLNEVHGDSVRDLGLDVLPGVRNILGKEVSIDFVRSDELS